jgi:hypothetical protein
MISPIRRSVVNLDMTGAWAHIAGPSPDKI